MLLDLAVKTLWRHKLRSLLTILGVATAVQLYLMSNNIMGVYNRDIQNRINQFAGKIFIQESVQNTGSGADFPSMDSSIRMDTANAILQLGGTDTQSSSAILFVPLATSPRPNMPPLYIAVGVEPGHELAFLGNLGVADGSMSLAASGRVILGASAASHYQPANLGRKLQPGDQVEIQGRSFVVEGILERASTLYDGSVILPLATVQEVFSRQSMISAVVLTAASLNNLADLKEAVQSRYPELQVSDQGDLSRNVDEMMTSQRMMFAMIEDSVILATAMVIMIVVVIAVMEQRKDIGTLRALGAKNWRILIFVAGQAILLSLLGGVVALPVFLIVNRYLNFGTFFSTAQMARMWLATMGACTIVGLLAAMLPAWQAVRVDPLEALQSR